jgi:Helicase conserved C-terminal domain/DEAD/DEAH box helicase
MCISLKFLPGGLGLPYSEARSIYFDELVQQKRITPVSSPQEMIEKEQEAIAQKVVDKLKPFLEQLVKETVTSITQNLQNNHHAQRLSASDQSSFIQTQEVMTHPEQDQDMDDFDSIYVSHDYVQPPVSPTLYSPIISAVSPAVLPTPLPSIPSVTVCHQSPTPQLASLSTSSISSLYHLHQEKDSLPSSSAYFIPMECNLDAPSIPATTFVCVPPPVVTQLHNNSNLPLFSNQSTSTLLVQRQLQRPQLPSPPTPIPTPILPRTSVHHVPTEQEALSCIGSLLDIAKPTWRCEEQKVAMQAVLANRQDVMCVLRTSAGKSMLLVVPPLLEKKQITVGIVPLNSLLLDYCRKFDSQHIPYEVFHSQHSPKLTGRHNLVLVTVDQARTPQWKQELAALNQRIPVTRVVFDEAHYAITDQDFRGVLEDVHDLRQFPFQVIVLSATIPPKSEDTIKQAFGLMNNVLIIRTPTRRPELEYVVEQTTRNNFELVKSVEKILQNRQSTFQKEDRVLIFVPFLDFGETLAEKLGCDFYRGGNESSPEEKLAMYNRWIQGENRVMVCTNAFGAGNDYSHVPLVIHAGTPRNMMNYIQESSRAGRNGKPSLCIILPRLFKAPGANNGLDHKGEQEMYDTLFGKKKRACIAYSLTLFNDGVGVSCFDSPNQILCSRCKQAGANRSRSLILSIAGQCSTAIPTTFPQPRHTSNPSSNLTLSSAQNGSMNPSFKRSHQETTISTSDNPFETTYQESQQRKIAKRALASSYVERFRRSLHVFTGLCAFCLAMGSQHTKVHPISDCLTLRHSLSMTEFLDFSRGIRYGKVHKHAICYLCHIPQIDEMLHPPFDGKGGTCNYPDTLASVALAVYLDRDARAEAAEYFIRDWEDISAFMDWLGSRPSEGHYSRVSQVFLWFTEISETGKVYCSY